MSPSRLAYVSAFMLVAIALVSLPLHAAAPPRVVALAELAARPVEVALSTKQLTLIHFETGEVSMVAVGDPAIVSVTVKGPDVLLKALASSGSTNAFIWQAGRYTQWTFTVRQNSRDARLIVVKDSIGTGAPSSLRDAERKGSSQQTRADQPRAAAASAPHETGATVGSATTVPAPAQQPSAASGSEQPTTSKAVAGYPCEKLLTLDQFLKTLNGRQREAFGVFIAEPTLPRLQVLLRELGPQQRCDLLALLSDPAPLKQAAADSAKSTGSASGPSVANVPNNGQAPPQTAQIGREPEMQATPSSEVAQPDGLASAAVVLTVIPEIVDGQLFLYYTLENQGEATLLTDILRLRILDRHGHRLAYRINRVSQAGYLGRLEADGVEYGVIAIDTPERTLVLEWKLVRQGSGTQQVMRAEVQVPEEAIDLESP